MASLPIAEDSLHTSTGPSLDTVEVQERGLTPEEISIGFAKIRAHLATIE